MHAVGRASATDPILVILNYKGDPENKDNIYSLVGKGVTFDAGGLSLKMAMMEYMYGDKGGACACLSVFKGVVE
jgi:leucyl aminopeptidase